ncbi:MAG: WD40 repeat protein [Akkermansiaceae bacterium]|jgi:WD40 repeat protein
MLHRLITPFFCLATFFPAVLAAEKSNEPISYYNDIRPIFQANCLGCHQPSKNNGDYVMTDFDRLLAGGEDAVAIVPGKPDESYLIEEITPNTGGDAEMPKKEDPLHELEIALIRQWITAGAIDDTPENARQRYDQDHLPVYSKPPIVTSLDYSPDGSLLAISGFHEVILQKADGSGPVARLVGLSERIESVRFSPDGTKLAVTGGLPGRMGEVQVWDVAKKELILSAPVTFDTIYGAAWSPDGTKISFGCADNTVRAIDAKSGKQVLFQGGHSDWVFDTAFNPKGDHLVSVSRDMTAKLTELATQRLIDNITSITPNALKGGMAAVVSHPTRDEILVGGSDGIPKLYRIFRNTPRKIGDDANLLLEFPPMEGRIFAVDISMDARRIAAGSSLNGKGAIHIYEVNPEATISPEIAEILKKPTHERNDEMRQKLQKYFDESVKTLAAFPVAECGIFAVSFNPDGSRLAASGADGKIRILDAASGQLVTSFLPVEITPDAQGARHQNEGPANLDKRLPLDPEQIPEGRTVVRLDVRQEGIAGPITIDTPYRYAQVIVSAELDSGDIIDVTRMTQNSVAGDHVTITETGVIRGVSDGNSRINFTIGGKTAAIAVAVSGMQKEFIPAWTKDVNPVVARMGCNTGTCHGSKDGKNGFKLSLRGYDPLYDVRAFTDDIGSRRVNLASPDDSLMLLKATSAVPHEGGQLTKPGDDYYEIVRAWIGNGAKLEKTQTKVLKIEVYPLNPVVQKIGSMQQMRVIATYPGGETRDVTTEAVVTSGNGEVAETVKGYPALIKVIRRGEAPILVRYEGAYAATTVTAMGDRSGFAWTDPPKFNEIDTLVAQKWQRMKTLPSEICTDLEFVRRVHLDLTGLPPTVAQVKSFLADARHSQVKRDALIDALIGNPAFIEFWTNKWSDMLQVNRKFLAPEGAKLFRSWIRKEVAENTPYDEFARKVITATGSNKDNPPASYYKILRTPEDTMENTTHLFLATRFNCNKCHDHPFERWTQDNYYEMAAFFAQVGLKEDPASGQSKIGGTAVEGAKPLYEIIYQQKDGEQKHERTGAVMPPSFPYEADHVAQEDATRREDLAGWMTSPDNRYFASSYANRVWGYMMGTGIIEPLDDIRAGNPPSNPELLAWLAQSFIASDFNIRELMRVICKSRTYQLSIKTNKWNEDDTINFSHAKARRLPAEVLYDSIHAVTGARSKFPGVPKGTRASSLPDVGVRLPDSFLANFGRPVRESSCECERSSEMQLGPIMALLSGPTVGDAISDPGNEISKLAKESQDDRALIEGLFYRILNRPATELEIEASLVAFRAGLDQDQATLEEALAEHLKTRDPTIAAAERKRESDISASKAATAAHEKAIKPRLDAAAQKHKETLAALEKEKKDYHSDLPAKITQWKQELADGASLWTALQPTEMTSNNGAILTVEGDQAIIATGTNGKTDYTLTAATDLSGITAVRLEMLADDRLPGKGPGRQGGNFVLGEFELEVAPASDPRNFQRVTFSTAKASFSQTNYDVAKAIDGKPGGPNAGWAISPEVGKNQSALFGIGQPIGHGGGSILRFTLKQPFDEVHTLGKFRLSVTTKQGPLPFGIPENITLALALAKEKRNDQQTGEITKFFRDNDASLKVLDESLAAAKKPLPLDPKLGELRKGLAALENSPRADPRHDQLSQDLELSTKQLGDRRLTGAQDLTWALINTPAFLFNH